MQQTFSISLLVVLALIAANLPFFNGRLFALFPWPLAQGKRLSGRLLELLVCYFVVGGIGMLLEQRLGQPHPQGWEFYATTAALFLALAFPGFVYRYLWRSHA